MMWNRAESPLDMDSVESNKQGKDMAYGDIHNDTGTICKAQERACPLGTEGHSKDVDSFVEYHVRDSGVDGRSVRAMIEDGTPPGDAIAVAKEGLEPTGAAYRKQKAEEAEINRETYGHIQNLSGEERDKAIKEAESMLVQDYAMARSETDPEDREELRNTYKESLAAIHGVSPSRVTGGDEFSSGIEVDRADGGVSIYAKSTFRLKKSLDGLYESDADQDEMNREVYGHIAGLKGEERRAAIAEAESNLALEYAQGLNEAESITDDVPPGKESEKAFDESQRDKRQLKRAYSASLSAIHGGATVMTYPSYAMSVRDGDEHSIYSSKFERTGTIRQSDSADYKSALESSRARDVSESTAFGKLPERTILVGKGFGVDPRNPGWGYREQNFELVTPNGSRRPVDREVALNYLDELNR